METSSSGVMAISSCFSIENSYLSCSANRRPVPRSPREVPTHFSLDSEPAHMRRIIGLRPALTTETETCAEFSSHHGRNRQVAITCALSRRLKKIDASRLRTETKRAIAEIISARFIDVF